jgi:hypothetical protein
MLQWLYTYASSVCFKCFSCFRRMLQVFLSGCCICGSDYTHISQAYLLIVSSVSDVCCNKFFHIASVSWKRTQAEAVPRPQTVSTCAREAMWAQAVPRKRCRHVAAGPGEFVGRQASEQAGERGQQA